MATTSSTITNSTPTNSAVITSLKPISDMLAALATAGVLTKASDTGQIVWSSWTTSGLNQTGWEIYSLNDTNATAAPVFMKWTYTSGSATSNDQVVAVQLGTGSDGAGNLANATATVDIKGFSQGASPDGTARACYASAGEGYFTMFGGISPGSSNSGQFSFVVERLRDYTTGNITTDGICATGSLIASSSAVTALRAGSTTITVCQGAAYAYNLGLFASSFTTLSNLFAQTNFLCPPVQWQGGSYNSNPMFDGTNFILIGNQPRTSKLYAPMSSFISIDFGSFTEGVTTTLSVYGGTHAYFASGAAHALVIPGVVPPALSTAATTVTYQPFARMPLFRYE